MKKLNLNHLSNCLSPPKDQSLPAKTRMPSTEEASLPENHKQAPMATGHLRIAINETEHGLDSSYLVTPISGAFSFVERVGFLLLPLPLSRIRRLLLVRVVGFEEAWVVRRRGNPKSGVWLVEDTNRVNENGVGVFESVNAGFRERR